MTPMGMVLTVAGVLGGLWLLHRTASWAEGRGWIHYRNPPTGSVSHGLSQVDALFRPEVEHVVEMRNAEAVLRDDADSEAPPRLDVDVDPPDDDSEG